jgi:hypothetical protein
MTSEEHAGRRNDDGERAAETGLAPPTASTSRLDEFAKRMYPRSGVERLQSHLQATYGIAVTSISELDLGVFRVERPDGPRWVTRLFPAVRAMERTVGVGEILDFLAGSDFPAERCAAPDAVSELDGQCVLVTEYVSEVPRDRRRETIRGLGGVRSLGEMLGRLAPCPRPTVRWCATAGRGIT